MKKTNGITLIALIITVIVMLILVAVTVSVVINSNLIGTAQNAADRTEQAYKQEGNNSEIKINGKIYANMEDYKNGVQKILDDSLPGNEYLKTFITEWTVEAGDKITLPIYEMQVADEESGEVETYFNYNFTVDYGDGTIAEITSFNDGDKDHTYTTAGTYKVKIDGVCEAWSFTYVPDSVEKVTKLVQWGAVQAKHIDFKNCTNLTGEIPVPSTNSFKYVKSFARLFYYCTGLKGKIPSNLFQYATEVVTLRNAFNYAGVTGTIPEDLLANCTKLTNVGFLFGGAEGLIGKIPGDLLNRCNNLIYAEGVFAGCSNLTGNIPLNLLKECKVLISVDQIFDGCTGLSGEIPENLFVDCDELRSVATCFRNCVGLTGTIPENLFDGKVNITNVSNAFSGCVGLSGSIPENLLEDCTEITTVAWMFNGCIGLSGAIPLNLFVNNSKITRIRDCFNGCTGLGDSELKLTTKLIANDVDFKNIFENINSNITLYIPKGSLIPTKSKLSTTANITIIEYDLE